MARRAPAAAAAVLVAALVAAALAPPALPSAAGVYDAKERGCYCHSDDASPAVGFSVTGLPGRYTVNATYTLHIAVVFTDVPARADRPQGGFSIEATSGNFTAAAGFEDLVLVNGSQATHSTNGSRGREWTLNWTAPGELGFVVTFWVFVNTVDGSRSESFGGDRWTMKTIRVGVGNEPDVINPPPPSPPFAIEAYGLIVVAAIAGLYAFFTFRGARKVAPEDAPDHRAGKPARRKRPPA
jgi:hypothetical protein